MLKKSLNIKWPELIFYLIPVLWFLGIHVADISRGIAGLALISLIFTRSWFSRSFEMTQRKKLFLAGFIGLYCLFIAVYQLSKVYAGTQGIDFAIFSQAIDSVYRWGFQAVTLICPDRVNFLGHHFVPYLYIPGALGFFGLPGYISGAVFHALGVAGMAACLYFICRHLKLKPGASLLLTALILMNPSIRHTVFWGIHDETFALPFIALAYLSWQLKRHWLCFLALVFVASTKESMFLFNICFCLMVFLQEISSSVRSKSSNPLGQKSMLPYGMMLILSLAGFVSYFFLQPLFISKDFDHFNKIASIAYLLSPEIIKDKLIWLVFLFVPVLGLPFWGMRLRHILLLLPAAPFIGIVLISGFDPMHSLMNYYATVPSLIIAIASLFVLSSLWKGRLRESIPAGLVIIGVSVAFSFATNKPGKDFYENVSAPARIPDQLNILPDQSNIVATSSAALFLFRCDMVRRLWLANILDLEFDYIVTKPDEDHLIGRELKARSKVCFESSQWKIRCANGADVRLMGQASVDTGF